MLTDECEEMLQVKQVQLLEEEGQKSSSISYEDNQDQEGQIKSNAVSDG